MPAACTPDVLLGLAAAPITATSIATAPYAPAVIATAVATLATTALPAAPLAADGDGGIPAVAAPERCASPERYAINMRGHTRLD